MNPSISHRNILQYLFALFFCSISAANTVTIQNATEGYSFELPDGWVEIPKPVLDSRMSAAVSAESRNTFSFCAGYQAAAANEGYFIYPYLLVQITPYPNGQNVQTVSEQALRKIVSAITGLNEQDISKGLSEEAAGILRNVHGQSATYSTNPPGYRVSMTMTAGTIGVIQAELQGLLGFDHMVCLNFYCKQADWTKLQPTFEKMATSFRLTGGQPRVVEDNSNGFHWNQLFIATLGGAAIGGIVSAVGFLFKKKKAN